MVMTHEERLQLSKYQEQVVIKLTEAEAAVLDAKARLDFTSAKMQLVVTETNVLAAVLFKRLGVKRIVITHAEYLATDQGEELHSERIADGTIIYEMKGKGDGRKER